MWKANFQLTGTELVVSSEYYTLQEQKINNLKFLGTGTMLGDASGCEYYLYEAQEFSPLQKTE